MRTLVVNTFLVVTSAFIAAAIVQFKKTVIDRAIDAARQQIRALRRGSE
jgi:hypothetical protein